MRELQMSAGCARFTLDEPWTEKRIGHWYDAQADYAKSHLKGEGKCLVIGSPIFEALELEEFGWDVTYLDVRKPPSVIKQFVLGDAADLPFPADSFDAVSSTCVLCHVGLGRYGDDLVEDGDEKMLAGISRVLKKGARAALTFGPVSSAVDTVIRLENWQRVYTVGEAKRMAQAVGLKIVDTGIFSLETASWGSDVPLNSILDAYYLSMCVEK